VPIAAGGDVVDGVWETDSERARNTTGGQTGAKGKT
jgi:hypothetical protein